MLWQPSSYGAVTKWNHGVLLPTFVYLSSTRHKHMVTHASSLTKAVDSQYGHARVCPSLDSHAVIHYELY